MSKRDKAADWDKSAEPELAEAEPVQPAESVPTEPTSDDKGAETREEDGGVTVYSAGGVDLLSHKKGTQHYRCLHDIPSQGLVAGMVYHLSPPNYEESLGHVVANFTASVQQG